MVPGWGLILALCLVWYSVSSINNVIGKSLLNQFPYPMTLTLVQLLSISIYSEPILRHFVKRRTEVESGIFKKIIVPLAIGKFLASVSSHISMWKVPVSYSHTVKATMPLFTVVLARILFGEKQSKTVYWSLVPIITGVVIATATEFHFDTIGLISALVATCGFSLQNIFSKKVLKLTGMHQFQLLATLGRISLGLFFPIWFLIDARRLMTTHPEIHDPSSVLTLLFLDGFLNFAQNILAFTLIQMVTPLTYAVANATKRIAIISVSIFLLRNPVSSTNVFGMCLAVFGVLLYNRAKHIENRRKTELPTKVIKNDSNFNYITNGISSV